MIALLAAIPAWPQADGSSTPSAPDDSQMATPPPVSGEAYPTAVGAEERSNYLSGGIGFSTTYIDNLYAGSSGAPLSEVTYSIQPTISFDQTTPRQHRKFTYSPGFTFYRPTSGLDEIDQNANVTFSYRLTPHTNFSVNDVFQKSSTSFGLSDSITGGVVSGAPQPVVPGIIAPFAERLSNNAQGQVSFQFSPVGMIGASASLGKLNYPNPAEATGLYNSDERGAGAFYNRRLSTRQYMGANYQYSQILAHPVNAQSETQMHMITAFYTIYLGRNLSISASGGPEHSTVEQTSLPASRSWGPIVITSVGWQGDRTSFAASYAREVTGGGGLVGAYHSNSANVSGRWQAAHTWTAGASASYAINKSLTPFLLGASQEGHSVAGQATITRSIGRQFTAQFEYDRVHQSYTGITAIASNPNSDREMISLGWQFGRPLGR